MTTDNKPQRVRKFNDYGQEIPLIIRANGKEFHGYIFDVRKEGRQRIGTVTTKTERFEVAKQSQGVWKEVAK